ncbi:hypothetical protein DBR39_05595 [Chryseobacterium sp. KBW03]|uniref:bacteriocin-like protein n=1 Tax=unclassified Chryseobacterium TaxID=2593645 RepID=UPI000F5926E0|nr:MULTISPECIES: hypothetical protein [unclassified Chryseobacterium]RQO40422.1 hypothetical protein DBR39_05595 [Chryseobacterium sp. KBW03]UKB77591.1 hypothetical protein LF886_13910 [Chryseobacterium sp. MEBOG07]
MKNFKKLTRDNLKDISGGAGPIPHCRVGYIYMCQAEAACFPDQDIWDCACGCVPVTKPV